MKSNTTLKAMQRINQRLRKFFTLHIRIKTKSPNIKSESLIAIQMSQDYQTRREIYDAIPEKEEGPDERNLSQLQKDMHYAR